MTPYRKKDELTWTLTIPTGDPARPYARVSSGTRDKPTADQMQKMLDLLGGRGKRLLWVRDAILARRLRVGAVYDAWLGGTLDELQATLEDLNLAEALEPWVAALEARVRDETFSRETFRKYRAQVQALVAGGLWRSQLTTPALRARLDALPGSGTNRRRHAAAWMHFLDYCVETGRLPSNPLRTLKLPPANRTKDRYAEWPHVVRLLHAMPEGAHRALAAIRHGAGLEMQAALAMCRRDVDLATKVVWAHGRKNANRDRQAIVLDDACWDLFASYVRGGGFLPDAPLFPVAHGAHADAQAAACEALRAQGVPIREGYTLHGARHSFGVEMARRGYELKLISANLGHANEVMAMKLYAKYRPRAEDLMQAAKRRGAQQ
ncbi:MAG: site-specific integrase [Gemmatimonadaceae bacterium]|nr:site-specific integrase [Gemmatimonadaceae bacterium]